MSKYSTELRFICESLAGRLESEGYSGIEQIIADSRAKIFSFDYPLFSEDYKATLETKIIKHYYTREICAETYGRWKLFLESRMQEIMPYYNELYKTTLKEYDIFEEVNYTRSGTRNIDEAGESSSTTNSAVNGEEWQKYSDTPQGSVQNIENDSYLTNATKNTIDQTTQGVTAGEQTNNTLEEYTELIKGKYPGKSYMELIKQFRDNLLNIDSMIINELNDLFMMVY